jgi:hypothetical protein
LGSHNSCVDREPCQAWLTAQPTCTTVVWAVNHVRAG